MTKNISIKKNFMMNAILTMSAFIFPLITFPYISRVLGPVGNGKVNFANSVLVYFGMFSQLGIPTYGVRATAQVRDDREQLSKTVQELFLINLFMSLITYVVFFISLFSVSRFSSEKPLFLIYSLTIMANTIGMEYVYKGLEDYTYITIQTLIFRTISVIFMFLMIKEEQDYVMYGLITTLSSTLPMVLYFFHLRKYVDYKIFKQYNFKRHIRPICVFFAMSAATLIYTNLDTVMLGFMKTDADVGYYSAAVRIKSILVSIVTSLGTVLLPRASYYYEHGEKKEFERIARKALHFVIIFATPITLYFILFAKEGILFLSGDQFIPAVLPMQVIMPTLLMIGLTNIMGIQIMVPIGKEKYVLYSEIGGAITDVILNALLIPIFAATGAAIGTLAAEAVVWGIQFYLIKDMLKPMYKGLPYFDVIAAMAVATVSCIWIKALNLNSFVTLLLSAVLFFSVYAFYMLWRKDEMSHEIVQTVLRKLK